MALYWPPVTRSYADSGPPRRVAPPNPPLPPRPNFAAGPPRYVMPQGAVGPPSPYTATNGGVYRLPQPDLRPGDRDGGRAGIRSPYGTIYHGDGGVQVIGTVPGSVGPMLGLPPLALPPHEAAQLSKKPRIDNPPLRLDTPLRIDTNRESKEPGYQPQVEAISPTPEDRPAEREDVKSTKDDLLQKISKVDREIAKAESSIAKLKKKQEELEDSANKPTSDSAAEDEKPNQSIAQNVYSENRRKASQSHASLNKFSAGNELPLYNQPSDTEVYNINKRNYTIFKKKLVEYFKKKNEEKETRDRYLTVTYCKLTSVWSKKVERLENSKKRKEKEGKCREMYEKMFPELKKRREDKVREDKDRDIRLGSRGTVRSDQDLQDVMERLQEQEMEEKKMHSYAVIPPPLLPPDERKRKFINNNGLTQDPHLLYNERKFINMWTEAEKEIFKEKYLQHPKNFGMISQYLERKSVSDCVQYYYLSKKTENYKQLLRKSRTRGTRRRHGNNPAGEVIAPNVTRVVTRRTVQELQEKDSGENSNSKNNSRSNTPLPATALQQQQQQQEENGEVSEKEGAKGKKERAGRDKKVDNESSDDDDSTPAVKCGPHPCAVCKSTVESSRPVQKSQAAQLGLQEDEVTESSRVCNTCWCKTVRLKHPRCPLLSCSTSSKVKKLRHLPGKWAELSQATRDTLSTELQIPEGTKSVCATCFGRINKRIGQLEEGATDSNKTNKTSSSSASEKESTAAGGGVSVDDDDDLANWNENEIELVKQSLRAHGNSQWERMAETLPDRTAEQCKQFFYNHRKRLQLDKIVHEFKKANRPEGSEKPSLTSDEESGSSTSSCEDDTVAGSKNSGDKDTKTAASKPTTSGSVGQTAKPDVVEVLPVGGAKKVGEEGYDSAATISADETSEQDRTGGGQSGATRAQLRPFVHPNPGAPGGPPGNNLQMVGGPPGSPYTKTIYVKDLMKTVIEQSLQPAGGVPTTNIANINRGNEIPNLKNMLQDAGPAPHGNFVRGALSGLHKDLSRPELEVRPVVGVPGHPPSTTATLLSHSSPATVAAIPPPQEDGVLNLTTTRRDRSTPPAPHPGAPSEPSVGAYRASPFIDFRDNPVPQSRGKEPPAAHGSTQTKITHKASMNMDLPKMPVVYGDQMSSLHSPSHMVARPDPRKDLLTHHKPSSASQPPPNLHSNKAAEGGSITRGQPIPQLPSQQQQQQQQAQHSLSRYAHPSQKGSLTSGTPVYTDRRPSSGPYQTMPDVGRAGGLPNNLDIHKKTPSPYPAYSRPPSHDSRGSSSRSVIENDYKIAQSLPRKTEADDIRAYQRSMETHRANSRGEVQLVEPRGDPRYPPDQHRAAMYPPRMANAFVAREPIRGDPRADIPQQRDSGRGDPRGGPPPDPRDVRPDYRDPRDRVADPRGRPPYSAYDSRGVPSQMTSRGPDPSRRSPPPSLPSRTISSSGSMVRGGHPGHSLAPSPRPGSITSGLPREIVAYGRQPEVTISKQPALGGVAGGSGGGQQQSRAEYPHTSNLSNLADIALKQPKLMEANDHRGGPSVLTVTRADSVGPSSRMAADISRIVKYDDRSRGGDPLGSMGGRGGHGSVASRLEEEQRRMFAALGQMSDQERVKFLNSQFEQQQQQAAAAAAAAKRSEAAAAAIPTPQGISTATLIDLIVTNQINQGNISGTEASLRQAYVAAAASAARNSPQISAAQLVQDASKQNSSRSPSIKAMTDRDMLMESNKKLLESGKAGPSSSSLVRTSPAGGGPMGTNVSINEHLENMITKEVQSRTSSPYAIPSSTVAEAHEHWKRRQQYQTEPSYTLARPPSQSGGGGGGGLPRPPSGGVSGASGGGGGGGGGGGLGSDERQIIRVAQNASPHPDKPQAPPPSHGLVEPISPPNSSSGDPQQRALPPPGAGAAYYYQGFHGAGGGAPQPLPTHPRKDPSEMDPAGKGGNSAGFDYENHVRHKIAEAMKNDKSGVSPGPSGGGGGGGGGEKQQPAPPTTAAVNSAMGPPNKRPLDTDSRNPAPSGGDRDPSGESPRKRYKQDDSAGGGGPNDLPDSPGSGEMVIDERPDSAHSHKTASPAPPHPATDLSSSTGGGPGGSGGGGGHYPAGGYRGAPPRSSPGVGGQQRGAPPPPQQQQQQQQGVGGARYEPLSDDD